MTPQVARFLAVLLCLGVGTAATAATRSAAVRTIAAQERTLVRTVDAYGRVEAAPDAVTTLSLPRAASIAGLAVRPGERVKKGQRLYRLETAPAVRAAYEQARAALTAAEADLSRVQHLHAEQLATNSQLAAAKTAVSDAKSKVEALRAVGAERQNEIIRAPATGVVTTIALAQGQRAPANTAVLTLADTDKLQVILGAEPEAAAGIQQGMQAKIQAVFGPKKTRKASVVAIGGTPNPTTRRINVVVAPKVMTGLQLGQSVTGTIILGSQQAIAVPRSAVLSDQKGYYLFVVKSGKARRVDIEPGIEANGYIAVPNGVHANDHVVIQGNYELEDGMAVRDSGS